MSPLPPSARRWLAISDRIYRLLLATCPPEFRRVYGAPMAQAFRDSCRAAHRARGLGGMLRLWPFALIDLAATALAERLTEGVARVRTRWTRLGNLVAAVTGQCARAIGNTGAWMRLGSMATVTASLLWIAYMLLNVANEWFVAVIAPPSAVWQAKGVFIARFVAWQVSPAMMLLLYLELG